MSSGSRVTWLGLTPEPERELPAAVAALRCAVANCAVANSAAAEPAAGEHGDGARTAGGGAHGGGRSIETWCEAEISREAERRRIESVILHGTQRAWMRYLGEVTQLITRVAAGQHDPRAASNAASAAMALTAAETVLEHHRMLIGLPGSAYDRVATDRAALSRIVAELQARLELVAERQ